MDPEKSVAIVVKKLTNQFHRYMNGKRAEIIAKVNVEGVESMTEVHGRIIEYLYENMGKNIVYQRDLEKRFNIQRSTATVILQRMEKYGFIRREVSGEDGRMKELRLTEKAKAAHPRLYAEIVKAEAQAKKGIPAKEMEVFFRVTKKIIKNME